jgi:RNA polymerase sigma-70 factor (ECF subfamily)
VPDRDNDVDIDSVLAGIAAGDKGAYARVVSHYQVPLFGFLGRLGLTQALAEEIAQETFIRAWLNLGTYDARKAAFSTWLFTIARNLALSELARGNRRMEPMDALAEIPGEGPLPREAMEAQRRRSRLGAALQALPMAERGVLALAYIRELDLSAIARIEACTVGAVKVRLHRARNRLRALLEKGND